MEIQEQQLIFRVSSNQVLIEIELRRFTDIRCPFVVEFFNESLDEFIQFGMFAFNAADFSLLKNSKVTKNQSLIRSANFNRRVSYSLSNVLNCSIGCV